VTRASHLPEILRHVAKAFQDHGVVGFAEVQAAAPGECDRSRIENFGDSALNALSSPQFMLEGPHREIGGTWRQ
jgi:hypothetical protein